MATATVLQTLYRNTVRRRAPVQDWVYPDPDKDDNPDEAEAAALDWYHNENKHKLTFWPSYAIYSEAIATGTTGTGMGVLVNKGAIFDAASKDVGQMLAAFAVVLSNTHYFARGPMQIPPTVFVVLNEFTDKLGAVDKSRHYGRICILHRGIVDGTVETAWLIQERSTGKVYGYGSIDYTQVSSKIFRVGPEPYLKAPGRHGPSRQADTLMRTLELSLMDDRRLVEGLLGPSPEVPSFGVPPTIRLLRSLVIAGISPWIKVPGIEKNDTVVPTEPMDKATLAHVRAEVLRV